MVLVMGLGAQLVAWPIDFVDLIVAEGFRVIRYDNRDVGLSTKFDHVKPPGIVQTLKSLISRRFAKAPYRLTDMAGDLALLLDELGIAKAHVVGASMGGMIAQTFAIRYPDRALSLTSIMSNTGGRRHGGARFTLVRKLMTLRTKDPAKALEMGVEGSRLISGPMFDVEASRLLVADALDRSVDTDGTARQLAAIAASPDRTGDLGRLKIPTLVVHGLLDQLVKPSGGEATARAVPGSRLLMLPDMAHDLPRNRWPEVVTAIVDNAHRAGVASAHPSGPDVRAVR